MTIGRLKEIIAAFEREGKINDETEVVMWDTGGMVWIPMEQVSVPKAKKNHNTTYSESNAKNGKTVLLLQEEFFC